MARRLEENGYTCPGIHIQSSSGIINYPRLAGNYARPGIAVYGVYGRREAKADADLLPVLSLKARVVLIRNLSKGESAGYGFKYVSDKNRIIAVLSIGYADGIPRSLSFGRGSVLAGGKIAPIIGYVCMDQVLIDITGIPSVRQGDIVTVIGREGNNEITVYELAECDRTITNEILSRLGSRLERILV